ncbi:MAG TPA: SRPBCC family protein [Acidobacteriaceae bacterium]|nr:SRPBCC family protein [Acidobacteriaceae bacterium]
MKQVSSPSHQDTPTHDSSSQLPFGPKTFGPRTLVFGATALIAYGLSRRSKTGTAVAAAGGGLLAYQVFSSQHAKPSDTRATFLVNASPEQAYQLWRNLENLPRFMSHLKQVRILEGQRSQWTASGPMDRDVQWTAEIVDDIPNQSLSWRSLPGSDVDTSGSVSFRADPLGRGTYITAEMQYRLPGGALGTGVATIFGKHPEFVVREDLRRFKSLLETGEVPTTVGQTHGPRGVHGHTEQVLFRETTNHPQPQAPLARTA